MLSAVYSVVFSYPQPSHKTQTILACLMFFQRAFMVLLSSPSLSWSFCSVWFLFNKIIWNASAYTFSCKKLTLYLILVLNWFKWISWESILLREENRSTGRKTLGIKLDVGNGPLKNESVGKIGLSCLQVSFFYTFSFQSLKFSSDFLYCKLLVLDYSLLSKVSGLDFKKVILDSLRFTICYPLNSENQ